MLSDGSLDLPANDWEATKFTRSWVVVLGFRYWYCYSISFKWNQYPKTAWSRALSGYWVFIILEWNKYPRTAWEWAPAAFAANLQMNWPSLLHNISSGIMLRMTANRNINNFTSVLMNTQSRCLRPRSQYDSYHNNNIMSMWKHHWITPGII